MNLLGLFKKRIVWRTAIYKVSSLDQIFDLERLEPFFLIGAQGRRKDKSYPSVCADPFLFVYHDNLYVFYELKTDGDHGAIAAAVLSSDGLLTDLGIVLHEPFHLSYPQVFDYNGVVYMLPETAQLERVVLYRAKAFPKEWEINSTLINGPLLDPTLLRINSHIAYLFGTTRDKTLKIFELDSMLRIKPGSCRLAHVDKAISRCGGSPLKFGESFVRVAQREITKYGESVAFYKIDNLSESYGETLVVGRHLFSTPPSWASEGHHHISVSSFRGELYVAVDGYTKDGYCNTLTYAWIVLKNKLVYLKKIALSCFQ
ncbi:hypothetical protein IYY11_04260 [Methylocystis sp. H62]|uniref:glucosamine inositolphosphorylceramide transferase family protein n=1 Tax=Methylocystis sp. H62 TaxID=2785789 RepID=UPI0018C2B721|nr:hypothetical protein [Methylocystis sp. H62]MBG0792640.1 hypothetical protein [Methylocystis sp. H62]